MGSSGRQNPRPTTVRRTAGDLVLNSIAWADLPVAGTLDITLQAVAGQMIAYTMGGEWGNEAVDGSLDVATIVAAAPVNNFGSGGASVSAGMAGWRGVSGAFTALSGTGFYVLQAADLVVVAGVSQVTLRPRFSTFAAVNKTLFGSAASAILQVTAQNLG